MTMHTSVVRWFIAASVGAWLAFSVTSAPAAERAGAADPAEAARAILAETGVRGGLIVHLGSADGRLTAALRAGEGYRVHGLDAQAANVEQARRHVQSLGLYGPVAIDRLQGSRLPYIENLANLVVADGGGLARNGVPMTEVLRVLCPGGVAYVEHDGQWRKTVKPRPGEMDEWTHCLYDATNNPVAHDLVGPPRRLQWVAGPRWSRHHDHMSSVSAVVSSGGRVFCIFDEGLPASIFLPSRWSLIARDAFNGATLWKRPIATWHTQLWPLKSGPAQLARRLVAVGETVYAVLDIDGPLVALDAATGETVREYAGTKATEEILYSDGVLFAVVRPDGVESKMHRAEYESVAGVREHRTTWQWREEEPRTITAIDATTGEPLWRARTPVAQSTLAVDAGNAYFYDGQQIVCLDRRNGQLRWKSEPAASRTLNHTGYTPNLVVHQGVVLFAGGDRTMTAFSAENGGTLWTAEHHRGGHNSPEDLLVVGGLVWSAAIAGGADSGVWTGRDLETGEVKNEFFPDVNTYWFHHRCYRAKATHQYLLPSRTGIEFVDFRKQTWEIHHWVRGACLYGIMPCNGLIYAPQHPCACYPEAKLDGFNALAPASAQPRIPEEAAAEERLERGPAYGQTAGGFATASNRRRESPPPADGGGTGDWPTLRGDAARSGRNATAAPTELAPAWQTELGGRLSAVTVAGGRLFVAQPDTHAVHALDAADGKRLWSYTAGGPVDSPPTIYQGLALFGSADGYVYCLRAADGELVWRFRAAPMDQRLVAYDRVESVWPVHGSVLVQDGVVHCAAGRNMFLDGGVWLYRLEPATGIVLSVTPMDDRHPDSGENLQVNVQVLNMSVAAPDILSSDGQRVYMKSQVFDMEGRRQALGPHSGDPAGQGSVQRSDEAHLFCPSGFLDDAYWHRTYWVYGRSFAGGHAGYHQAGRFAPSGRILVFDDERVYGFGREPQYYRWTTPIEHHLWAADKWAPEPPSAAARRGEAYIQVANSPSLNPSGKPLTVAAWIKAERPTGVILARGGPAQGYSLVLQQGRPQFVVRIGGEIHVAQAKQRVIGEWVHVAGVLGEDGRMEVYIDGNLAGTGKATGTIASNPSQPMEIGADLAGSVGDYPTPSLFTGLIDEVAVYHAALEAEQVKRLAEKPGEKPAQGEPAPVLHLTFDHGDARDESGNGNHGVVEGATPSEGKVGKSMGFAGPAASSGMLVEHDWTRDLPILVRAMVLAGETLFAAGPADLVDEEEAVRRFGVSDFQSQLAEQEAALRGRRGATLLAVSPADGSVLGELRLDSPPVWDGMAAAYGSLYLATMDGRIVCLGAKTNP